MNKAAIRISNLGKRYRLGIYENIFRGASRLAGIGSKRENEDFWALKDISLEIGEGEVVGVIGANGAGKSTLLKILSRITNPTVGRFELYGRVGSLLEVGTGFHPELTGRENIYLNGLILGMSRLEVDRKFDEIVAFSGVEDFIDTPVKRYSSGMSVRLAFSVAAHLEPEILLIDEVLSVGDLSFQQRSLGKMQDVASGGRTVVFVSHNMQVVSRLCSRGIFLRNGSVAYDGPIDQTIAEYIRLVVGNEMGSRTWALEDAPGNDKVRLLSVELTDGEGNLLTNARVSQDLYLRLRYATSQPKLKLRCLAVFSTQGVRAFSSIEPTAAERTEKGIYCSTLHIPPNLMADTEYTVDIRILAPGMKLLHVHEDVVIAFQVTDMIEGDSARGDYAGRISGVVRPLLHWTDPVME